MSSGIWYDCLLQMFCYRVRSMSFLLQATSAINERLSLTETTKTEKPKLKVFKMKHTGKCALVRKNNLPSGKHNT